MSGAEIVKRLGAIVVQQGRSLRLAAKAIEGVDRPSRAQKETLAIIQAVLHETEKSIKAESPA